jgi:hypothetical protein
MYAKSDICVNSVSYIITGLAGGELKLTSLLHVACKALLVKGLQGCKQSSQWKKVYLIKNERKSRPVMIGPVKVPELSALEGNL